MNVLHNMNACFQHMHAANKCLQHTTQTCTIWSNTLKLPALCNKLLAVHGIVQGIQWRLVMHEVSISSTD